MIFVTVGSQKFQFNRLLSTIDALIEDENIMEPVFAQIGYSDYHPKYYEYTQFLDRTEFQTKIEQSDIVLTHGGTGVIIKAIKLGKKVIAVPRLAKYGEHVDDHQLQLVGQFHESHLITQCTNISQLGELLKALSDMEFQMYQSNTSNIISSIEKYVESVNAGV